jgi:hypothetical protein
MTFNQIDLTSIRGVNKRSRSLDRQVRVALFSLDTFLFTTRRSGNFSLKITISQHKNPLFSIHYSADRLGMIRATISATP